MSNTTEVKELVKALREFTSALKAAAGTITLQHSTRSAAEVAAFETDINVKIGALGILVNELTLTVHAFVQPAAGEA